LAEIVAESSAIYFSNPLISSVNLATLFAVVV